MGYMRYIPTTSLLLKNVANPDVDDVAYTVFPERIKDKKLSTL